MSDERSVVEIETTIDAIGTVETHYYSTSGFSTKPTDTPANTYVAPRLKSAGNFRRELFSGTRVTGSVRPSFGEIVLFNNDAGLDDWLGYGVSGVRMAHHARPGVVGEHPFHAQRSLVGPVGHHLSAGVYRVADPHPTTMMHRHPGSP